MKRIIIYVLYFVFTYCCFSNTLTAAENETILFPSIDGLQITADAYIQHPDKKTPFIVLFHQAHWSRGEYLEIVPKLNQLGFNCMAVDLRSGKEVNGVSNETMLRAKAIGKGTTYVDALQDMEAALKYAHNHYAEGKVIAWGSSYSAALVLKIAGDRPDLVGGVLAFAPGEYFKRLGKPGTWIQSSAGKIKIPAFITSAHREKKAWSDIFDDIPSKTKASYLPDTNGNHGSRALWSRFKDSDGYWKAVTGFLEKNFKN
ncbi:MAG: alpha/beta hydrolase [Nitrospinota bacterium]